MSTLTTRIPESKHVRLRSLAKAKGVSLNRLIDEFAPSPLRSMTAKFVSERLRPEVRKSSAWRCWINWTTPSQCVGESASQERSTR